MHITNAITSHVGLYHARLPQAANTAPPRTDSEAALYAALSARARSTLINALAAQQGEPAARTSGARRLDYMA